MGLLKKTILNPIKSASVRILSQLAVKENNFPHFSPEPIRMTGGGGIVTGVDVHDFQHIKYLCYLIPVCTSSKSVSIL